MEERRAKIVATIGPACRDEDTLRELFLAGVNVTRLNFSHGYHTDHARSIELIRKISKELAHPVSILLDLQGPKIRVGELENDQIEIKTGKNVTLTTEIPPGSPSEIPVDFPYLPDVVSPGSRILLDDGNLELQVTAVEGPKVQAAVTLGGILRSNKGVNLPGANLDIPSFTEKDREDLSFGLQQEIDAVAISFVRTGQDVATVRQAIKDLAPGKAGTPIIAKLERPEALDNLEEIIRLADGVMVARGDLGVEMAPEMVPIAQKKIIGFANCEGKLVITATQMLDSMIHNPRPTRAETSDVANAIFDGSDAVMLSGETAIGEYPIKTVKMMDAIIRQSEDHLKSWGHWEGTPTMPSGDDAAFITRAARELAHDLNVAAIAVFTQTGRTAHLMSKALPRVPILGFTPEEKTYRRLSMYWGVFPYLVPFSDSFDQMLKHVDSAMVAATPITPGQQVVVISGYPVGAIRPPNLALLYTVGQPD